MRCRRDASGVLYMSEGMCCPEMRRMSCDTIWIQISSRSSRGRSKIVSLLWAMVRFFEVQVSTSKTHELNERDLMTGMPGPFHASLCTVRSDIKRYGMILKGTE